MLSRLDYMERRPWPALLQLPSGRLERLQSVMNAYSTSKYKHVTPLPHHWLKASQRIDLKLAVLVYKCLHGLSSAYLADELQLAVNSEARQRLRSSVYCPSHLTISTQSSSEDPSLLIVVSRILL